MIPTTRQNEIHEPYEQELAIKAPIDNSLPAAQVIAEQCSDVEQTFVPRFIP